MESTPCFPVHVTFNDTFHEIHNPFHEIYAGNTEIKPYKLGNKKACTYCEYKSICQFDTAEPSNSFKELKNLGKEEVHEKFEQAVKSDE